MKKGKSITKKVKLGGFELICLILFAWPLLAFALIVTGNLETFTQSNLSAASLSIFAFLLPMLIIYVASIWYNLRNPMGWIKMETTKKWKLCFVVSLVGATINDLLYANMSIVGGIIGAFISTFLLFTGANTLVLWLQGKGTFNSKSK